MAIQVQGSGGTVAQVDESNNLDVITNPVNIAGYPAAGGFYSVTGFTTAVIAVSLAANTNLATARFSASSTRKAYVYKLRVMANIATAGAAGGIPTVLGLVRFTTATPTGGTARTVNRFDASRGTVTDMTDVRDSNAALTVTSVVFGTTVASSVMPNSSTNTTPLEWIAEFGVPVVLAAGDGLSLQTLNAGPATATWGFSYNLYWFER